MSKKPKIDDFTKYVIKEAGLESPSSDFVLNVINVVKKEEKTSKVFVYKPIISNKTWFVIGLILTVSSIYYVLNSSTLIVSKYSYLYDSYLTGIKEFYTSFGDFSFSPVAIASFLIFTGFMVILLLGIKRLFNQGLLENYSN
jgi:hypothetical protein